MYLSVEGNGISQKTCIPLWDASLKGCKREETSFFLPREAFLPECRIELPNCHPALDAGSPEKNGTYLSWDCGNIIFISNSKQRLSQRILFLFPENTSIAMVFVGNALFLQIMQQFDSSFDERFSIGDVLTEPCRLLINGVRSLR